MSNTEIIQYIREAVELKHSQGSLTRAERNSVDMFIDNLAEFIANIESLPSIYRVNDFMERVWLSKEG